MLKTIIIGAALLVVASSLQCHSCDSFLSCNTPFPVNCPPNARCYTLTKHGNLIAKGCAHSCESLSFLDGAHCNTCHHRDFCNSIGAGIGQGVVMEPQVPQIGGGVAPNPNQNYHIGHGVRPRSSSQTALGMVLALPAIARIF